MKGVFVLLAFCIAAHMEGVIATGYVKPSTAEPILSGTPKFLIKIGIKGKVSLKHVPNSLNFNKRYSKIGAVKGVMPPKTGSTVVQYDFFQSRQLHVYPTYIPALAISICPMFPINRNCVS